MIFFGRMACLWESGEQIGKGDGTRRSRRVASEAGFTLLELLLVLTIISLLSTIATPVFHSYIKRARTKRAMVEIRGIEAELFSYSIEQGRLPDTLEQLGRDFIDPWGRPYRYQLLAGKPLTGAGKVQSRKNRFLHPLNTDYDLYSVGPDGDTQLALTAHASHDDIIRANDGAYVGEAQFY